MGTLDGSGMRMSGSQVLQGLQLHHLTSWRLLNAAAVAYVKQELVHAPRTPYLAQKGAISHWKATAKMQIPEWPRKLIQIMRKMKNKALDRKHTSNNKNSHFCREDV